MRHEARDGLNCDKCLLIPEIKLDNSLIPLIQSQCPNKHFEENINLVNYLETGEMFKKENIKCKCGEYNNKNSNLRFFYCKDCGSAYKKL